MTDAFIVPLAVAIVLLAAVVWGLLKRIERLEGHAKDRDMRLLQALTTQTALAQLVHQLYQMSQKG